VRRDRVEIWTDILRAVEQAKKKNEATPPSRIQTSANVPHVRFWRHIEEMEKLGLIESEPLRATQEGDRFLAKSGSLRNILDLRGRD